MLIDMIEDNEIVIATGPAGTGKTYVTLAVALSLLGPVYKKVILVKSVTAIPGEDIGFLKGGMEQKMEPFVMSYMWNINKICGPDSAKDLLAKKVIEILPLAFIRGLSIDNSIVIIDEAQNIDTHTFKTIMTRIGENSKYIFLGDTEQIDRRHKDESCLATVLDIFSDSDLIGTIEFSDIDCVRNPIIPKILTKLRSNNI
jgi:phosphate starvation-inducible PhoH-like protein